MNAIELSKQANIKFPVRITAAGCRYIGGGCTTNEEASAQFAAVVILREECGNLIECSVVPTRVAIGDRLGVVSAFRVVVGQVVGMVAHRAAASVCRTGRIG